MAAEALCRRYAARIPFKPGGYRQSWRGETKGFSSEPLVMEIMFSVPLYSIVAMISLFYDIPSNPSILAPRFMDPKSSPPEVSTYLFSRLPFTHL